MNIKYYFNAGDTFIDEISKDTIEVIWDDDDELCCGRCYYRCDNDDGVKKDLNNCMFCDCESNRGFYHFEKIYKK